MLKFNVTKTKFVDDPKDDREIEIHLHVFADGDIGLVANEEMLLYLIRDGHISLNNLYPAKLREMGFQVDGNHIRVLGIGQSRTWIRRLR